VVLAKFLLFTKNYDKTIESFPEMCVKYEPQVVPHRAGAFFHPPMADPVLYVGKLVGGLCFRFVDLVEQLFFVLLYRQKIIGLFCP
jgi:hypothetical protein